MHQRLYLIIELFFLLLIGFPFVLLLLVRFTKGTIKGSGEFVILGYDEAHHEYNILEDKTYFFQGNDGPYMIENKEILVNLNEEIEKAPINSLVLVSVNNKDQDQFSVNLKSGFYLSPSDYDPPNKTLVISDIEGNFDGFYSFLISNRVMNEKFEWTYGENHLVLLGDFFDRGENVTEVLWLIYHLENQAESKGGKVHFILGNHEVMNIQGNWRYAHDKYKKLAFGLFGKENKQASFRKMLAANTHFGQWLRTKNTIERIGNTLFVHGGLSPELLPYSASLDEINDLIRENIEDDTLYNSNSRHPASVLMGPKGPLWYRGMAMEYKYYPGITEEELDRILEFYQVNQIVIGHTVVDDVHSEFGGKVWLVDVKHGKEKFSGDTRGLLIEDRAFTPINDSDHR